MLAWLTVMLVLSCQEKPSYPNLDVTLSDFAGMKVGDYVITPTDMSHHIKKQLGTANPVDRFLGKYYEDSSKLVWISRTGISNSADTLLSYLRQLSKDGFESEAFAVSQIEQDLKRMRNLDFTATQPATVVASRLECNLSKSFLRMATGERFGYINPKRVLNYEDVEDEEGRHKQYVHRFDLDILLPDSMFYAHALHQVDSMHLSQFLDESRLHDSFYQQLQKKLPGISRRDTLERIRCIANMERMRWKIKDAPDSHDRYVVVNLPAFRLWAVAPDSVWSMKIICGATKTKSPILNSRIKRIDLNPVWRVPMSITKKSLANAGPGYFSKNHMYFVDASGKKLTYASPEMRRNGKVSIVQEGGNWNSLGRIIFRFDNNFSVYLHHTNSPWAFQNAKRALSHGCIRLEEPLRLADFLLTESRQDEMEKLSYSFSCDLTQPDSTRLIKSVPITPEIPVYLLYYTLYPVPGTAKIATYDDIYGYDKQIYESLQPLLER